MSEQSGSAQALWAFRSAYLQRLRSQALEVRDALRKLQVGEGRAVEDMRRIAHRLHGTAGSFGFDDVSQAAAELEELADKRASYFHISAAATKLVKLMETAE